MPSGVPFTNEMKQVSKNIFVLAAFVLLLCSTVTSIAWGEDPARNVSEEQAEEARALFKEGVEAQSRGDWEKAYEALRKSYNLRRSFDTAANLGVVEFRLERYPAAARHLDYWLRNYPTSEDPERHARVKALFEEVRTHVGGVKVQADAPGAKIFIDGEPVGTSPIEYELFVREGSHTVRAELQERSASAEFEVSKGATAEVQLTLEDGSLRPASGLDDEGHDYGNASPSDPEQARQKRNWVPAYILGGVTVATLGTSMVFRGLAGSRAKTIDELDSEDDQRCTSSSDECDELRNAIQDRDTYIDVTNVTLVVSGVAAAATIGYVTYVLTKKQKRSTGINATVELSRRGGALFIGGRF